MPTTSVIAILASFGISLSSHDIGKDAVDLAIALQKDSIEALKEYALEYADNALAVEAIILASEKKGQGNSGKGVGNTGPGNQGKSNNERGREKGNAGASV
jgi:hypothetical protein